MRWGGGREWGGKDEIGRGRPVQTTQEGRVWKDLRGGFWETDRWAETGGREARGEARVRARGGEAETVVGWREEG